MNVFALTDFVNQCKLNWKMLDCDMRNCYRLTGAKEKLVYEGKEYVIYNSGDCR